MSVGEMLRMNSEFPKMAEVRRLKGRITVNWKALAGMLLLGGGLLAVSVTGCKPSSDKAGKPSGTNAATATPRSTVRTNPVAATPPGVKANPAPGALRSFGRTNLAAVPPRPGPRTNAVAATRPGGTKAVVTTRPGGTNAVAATRPALGKAWAGMADQFRRLMASKYFYPVVAVVALCVAFGAVSLFQFFKSKSRKAAQTLPAEVAPKLAGRPVIKKARRAPIHSCNVLQVAADARHLWQFAARGKSFALSREQTSFAGEALPARIVTKDWRNLFQRKLNIAWLPPEQVFLRVAQFPRSDFDETVAMVELQLERLSPMPVTQIVWSIQVLPHTDANLQTVIVMIAGRNAVEEFLGKLEGQGFLADRLEMPRLDQLQATAITKDGAWIYPEPASGNRSAVVAWWYGGVLQNLALMTLPPANRAASVREQLLQMAWAGEMEGWLTAPPAWHLVADPTLAAEWEPALREGLEQPVEVIPPLAPPALAALTAQRVARTEPQANLLPAEFSTRYQQQFVDRLWMRGLGAVIAFYLVGIMIYFAYLQFALMGTTSVEQQVANLGPTYTNSLQLKARFQVLKDRQELKWAALDCWKAVAELLPDGVELEQFGFNDGRRLTLNGSAPKDQSKQLLDFDADIHKAVVNGQLLFDPNAGDHVTYHDAPNNRVSWGCTLELKRGEAL